jgi:hypothetical protein
MASSDEIAPHAVRVFEAQTQGGPSFTVSHIAQPPRSIIQIAAGGKPKGFGKGGETYIFALCGDGSTWALGGDWSQWHRLPEIPQR